MIAKLRACDHALAAGVDDVVLVDGRDAAALAAAAGTGAPADGTLLTGPLRSDAARDVTPAGRERV